MQPSYILFSLKLVGAQDFEPLPILEKIKWYSQMLFLLEIISFHANNEF